jgi:hypothetical protein
MERGDGSGSGRQPAAGSSSSGSGSSKGTAPTRTCAEKARSAEHVQGARLRADGSKGAQTSSGEGSEAEVEEVEEESDDEFGDRTTAPVPKWEVLAGNRAVPCGGCSSGATPATAAEPAGAGRPGAVGPLRRFQAGH